MLALLAFNTKAELLGNNNKLISLPILGLSTVLNTPLLA